MIAKDKAMALVLVALGGALAFLLLLLWAAFWSGLTVSVLWGWFLVPLGLPIIGLWHAYGLSLIWSAFSGLGRKPQDDKGGLARVFLQVPLVACLLMAVGWLIKNWM